MARPKVEIDPELVKQMASWGAKTSEIAGYFACSTDTIERRFAAELTKGRSDLQMSLRQWQLKSAKAGNVAMLIWLGKQMLGQIDRAQLDVAKIPDDLFIEEAKRRLGNGSDESRDIIPVTNAKIEPDKGVQS